MTTEILPEHHNQTIIKLQASENTSTHYYQHHNWCHYCHYHYYCHHHYYSYYRCDGGESYMTTTTITAQLGLEHLRLLRL